MAEVINLSQNQGDVHTAIHLQNTGFANMLAYLSFMFYCLYMRLSVCRIVFLSYYP